MAAKFTRTFFFACLFSFFFNGTLFSQINLSGRVEDEKSKQPIFNACIYFNGTTIFTNTNDEGNFVFENLRLVNTEIVVFSPGYEVLVFKTKGKDIEGKKVVFRLKQTVPNAEKLAVDAESKSQAIIAFKEVLLGVTREANECQILNEDALYFLPGETSTEYKIVADTPLIIINKRLGYKINYNLVAYSVDILNREQNLYGFARYRELGNPANYSDKRRDVYEGSTMHFFRSLVNHQTYQEQFETYWMKPVEKMNVLKSPPPNLFLTNRDTALLEQVNPMSLLFIDSANELAVRLPYKLLVNYARNPSGKFYLLSNGMREGIATKGAQSFLRFSIPSIGINYRGELDDYTNVEYSGYWSYELLANKLPLNYDPEK